MYTYILYIAYLANTQCFANGTVRKMAMLCNSTLEADYKRIEEQVRRDENEAIYANEADWRKDRCRYEQYKKK